MNKVTAKGPQHPTTEVKAGQIWKYSSEYVTNYYIVGNFKGDLYLFSLENGMVWSNKSTSKGLGKRFTLFTGTLEINS